MTEKHRIIYICPDCFTVLDQPGKCCNQDMTCIDAGAPGDPRSKPLMDEHGHLLTRAPVWWVERYAWWLRENQPVERR